MYQNIFFLKCKEAIIGSAVAHTMVQLPSDQRIPSLIPKCHSLHVH